MLVSECVDIDRIQMKHSRYAVTRLNVLVLSVSWCCLSVLTLTVNANEVFYIDSPDCECVGVVCVMVLSECVEFDYANEAFYIDCHKTVNVLVLSV